MDKPNYNPDFVLNVINDELRAIQIFSKRIPSSAGLEITVTESPTGKSFKGYFKFKNKTGSDDWWFTWLKSERPEKIQDYANDAYNYIMKQLK